MSVIKAAKAALRKELKAKLNSLSSEEKARQSVIVQQKTLQHELYKRSQRVSIFLSMNDEIQTEPILRHALETGKTCFIPRYDSKSTYMDMVRVNSWEEYESLPVTKWQIKQPPLDKQCDKALSSGGLDLILIPGLAFSKEGHRMGRGRGYYDTYLTKCRELQNQPPSTVALAFKEQILPEIPTEDTDMPIDIILTAD
ncbi:5-formyltetrahydrofolate cyclo-ligase-like [Homarus americanus]|uniref:5-formyltetrahydrofolate cyclo-ligase n=1 Tax=Homarus americanus TaxID=6706 RepID=A0A8J5N481_HOMAM|nr:5-formyltetrahydrofolate cyclo-ligase-like [Homarus americanus]KAG7173031.1 5-formyltetrahydrofolate cyclo-ligase-like [Homarus americanus]